MSALHIFVSHSHQDDSFCRQLVRALRRAHADVWYDEHNMGSGQLGPTIEHELRGRPIFLLVLTPAALASRWVEDETRWAYTLYCRDRSRVILPVTSAPVKEEDIWLFLADFKRIESLGGLPYAPAEAVRHTVRALGLTPAGEATTPAKIPRKSEDAADLIIRGRALNFQGDHEEALILFERAAKLDSASVDVWCNIAYTLNLLDRFEDALAAAERAISLRPTEAAAWSSKAAALALQKRNEEALGAAEMAISLNPNLALGWNNKSYILNNLGRPQEALAAAQKAIALDPDLQMARSNRATAKRKISLAARREQNTAQKHAPPST